MSRGNEEIGGEKKKNYPIQEMTWDNIIFPNFSIVTLFPHFSSSSPSSKKKERTDSFSVLGEEGMVEEGMVEEGR